MEENVPYVIELFFEKKPELDKEKLLEALKKYTSNPEIDTFSETEKTVLSAGDIGKPSNRLKISMEQRQFDREAMLEYASSFRQSWNWRTAKETIQNCNMIIGSAMSTPRNLLIMSGLNSSATYSGPSWRRSVAVRSTSR